MNKLNPSSASAEVMKAILESEAAYAPGARLFGEPETLPENELNNVGYGTLLILKKPDFAIWIFRRNAAYYPESANVYDSLGDGLLAKGDGSGDHGVPARGGNRHAHEASRYVAQS